MMHDYFYGKLIQDAMLKDAQAIEGLTGFREAYEVLKVIQGKALFLAEHIRRLERTIELSGIRLDLGNSGIEPAFMKVIEANGLLDGNLRLSVFFSDDGSMRSWILGYTPHSYPTEEQFRLGVPVVSLNAMREDPNAKIMNPLLRRKSEDVKSTSNAYETILVDNDGRITEGSRSNIFFVRGNSLITAPDETVLEGVTRKILLEIVDELAYPCSFECLPLTEIHKHFVEASFLTGTSRDILPVSSFDGIGLHADHPVIRELQNVFMEKVEAYLKNNE